MGFWKTFSHAQVLFHLQTASECAYHDSLAFAFHAAAVFLAGPLSQLRARVISCAATGGESAGVKEAQSSWILGHSGHLLRVRTRIWGSSGS